MTPDNQQNEKNSQPGRYGTDGWKNYIERGETYEWLRFGKTKKARQRSHREIGMVVDFLQSLPQNQVVLDAPSGMGRFCEIIREQGHIPIAVDSNSGRIKDTYNRLDPPIPAVHADIMNLPFLDNAFDAVICFRLLHHLNADLVMTVLQEISRISKHALITFYSQNTWKFYRKHLTGKTPQGYYYRFNWILKASREAGWKLSPQQPKYSFFESLHAIWLTK